MNASLVIALGVVLLAVTLRRSNPIDSDFESAKLALVQIQEWAKWMTGLETAAIAGLGWLIVEKKIIHFSQLSVWTRSLPLIGFLCLGAAILCSGWILSSVPSQTIRLSGKHRSKDPCNFDVYEQPLYGFSEPIRLGHVMALNHWYWGVGMISLGLLVLLAAYGNVDEAMYFRWSTSTRSCPTIPSCLSIPTGSGPECTTFAYRCSTDRASR